MDYPVCEGEAVTARVQESFFRWLWFALWYKNL